MSQKQIPKLKAKVSGRLAKFVSQIYLFLVKIAFFLHIFDPLKMWIFLMVPFFCDFLYKIKKRQKTIFSHINAYFVRFL